MEKEDDQIRFLIVYDRSRGYQCYLMYENIKKVKKTSYMSFLYSVIIDLHLLLIMRKKKSKEKQLKPFQTKIDTHPC